MPSICVCTAPLIPTVHKSELVALILGEIALGGVDLTVVSVLFVDVTVLFDVLSVTIGSAASDVAENIIANTININFFIDNFL